MSIIGGAPGGGKTIFAQQVCFHNATPERRALYFNTLSEPTAKTLRYLQQFSFFDPRRLDDGSVQFVDLGLILRTKGLERATELIAEHVRTVKPGLVVIDSFKVFDDLAKSAEELRKFGYEVAINLMAWECTAFLIGEYGERDYETNPIFSIVDGLITLEQRELTDVHRRFLRIVKMRGTDQSRDEHTFEITSGGLEVFAPRLELQRDATVAADNARLARRRTGISDLDLLLGQGLSRGASLLISGAAGTGKTILSLEAIYRGAATLGEKGIYFSLEESEAQLLATARELGFALDAEIERGMVRIVSFDPLDLHVDRLLFRMKREIESLGALRIAVDSISVLFAKIRDARVAREKLLFLATMIQNCGAIGFLGASRTPGGRALDRGDVLETVADGVIVLTSRVKDLERRRFIEVKKLRNTAHTLGKHPMSIGRGGVRVFPRSPGLGPRLAESSPT